MSSDPSAAEESETIHDRVERLEQQLVQLYRENQRKDEEIADLKSQVETNDHRIDANRKKVNYVAGWSKDGDGSDELPALAKGNTQHRLAIKAIREHVEPGAAWTGRKLVEHYQRYTQVSDQAKLKKHAKELRGNHSVELGGGRFLLDDDVTGRESEVDE